MFAFYRKNLNAFIVASLFVGALLGYYLPNIAIDYKIIGDIFIRLLTLMIVPVIFFSMIVGILNLGASSSVGRLGLKAFVYYASTTALAVALGLVLVNIVEPGKFDNDKQLKVVSELKGSTFEAPKIEHENSFVRIINNIIPQNIIKAASEGNVLGLIFFSILFAVGLLNVGGRGTVNVKNISTSAFNGLIWMIDKILLLSPIGILFLIANSVVTFTRDTPFAVSESPSVFTLAQGLTQYFFTVIAGLLIHAFISLPLILLFFKIHPLKFLKSMFPAITTAFSTASSAATLPVTLDCLANRAQVPNRYASFVAPLGATVNMDGTAIYEAIAVLFIANMYGVDLTFAQQLIVFITATLSAIGAAAIPGAGLIMMIMILNAVGLPVEGIGLIVGVDRVLDMFRTGVNVWGDSIGAAVIFKSEKKVNL